MKIWMLNAFTAHSFLDPWPLIALWLPYLDPTVTGLACNVCFRHWILRLVLALTHGAMNVVSYNSPHMSRALVHPFWLPDLEDFWVDARYDRQSLDPGLDWWCGYSKSGFPSIFACQFLACMFWWLCSVHYFLLFYKILQSYADKWFLDLILLLRTFSIHIHKFKK